jgi:hypothetical protein
MKKKEETSLSEEERERLINYIKENDPFYEFTNFSFFGDEDLLSLVEKIKKEKKENL